MPNAERSQPIVDHPALQEFRQDRSQRRSLGHRNRIVSVGTEMLHHLRIIKRDLCPAALGRALLTNRALRGAHYDRISPRREAADEAVAGDRPVQLFKRNLDQILNVNGAIGEPGEIGVSQILST